MKITHVVFDIDGTLLDSKDANILSLMETLRATAGMELTYEECLFILGLPGAKSLQKLGISDVEKTLRLWEMNLEKYLHLCVLFDGIGEMVEKLLDRGYQLGVVTSRTRAQTGMDFGKMPLAAHFDVSLCADEVSAPKPDPAPLRKYMELTGTTPDQVVYVGDTANDCACAHSAGVPFVLAGWGAVDKAVGADVILDSPMELLSWLELE